MTRDETKELLMTINAVYPNFRVKPEQMTFTINAWSMLLGDYPAELVQAAFKIYVNTDDTGFAPSINQLIGAMNKVKHNEEKTEGEAWMLVKKAISDSYYHAEERFAELPPVVQKAVGSPAMLRQWGQCDTEDVNTVIMSNFQRAYKAELSKKEFNESIPAEIKTLIAEKKPGIEKKE